MKWRTKNGDMVPLSELQTPHLENILNMYRRKVDAIRDKAINDAEEEDEIESIELMEDEDLLCVYQTGFAELYDEYLSRS